jgi:hypothetical protein
VPRLRVASIGQELLHRQCMYIGSAFCSGLLFGADKPTNTLKAALGFRYVGIPAFSVCSLEPLSMLDF